MTVHPDLRQRRRRLSGVGDGPVVLMAGNGGVDDVLFGHFVPDEHCDRLPLVHDEHAIAETKQLDRVGGDQEDRRAGRG